MHCFIVWVGRLFCCLLVHMLLVENPSLTMISCVMLHAMCSLIGQTMIGHSQYINDNTCYMDHPDKGSAGRACTTISDNRWRTEACLTVRTAPWPSSDCF